MSAAGVEQEKAKAWAEILRLPNLFTVPGDPLAGALLAGAAGEGDALRTALCAAASLGMYAAGLLFNDVADLEEDRRDRPARPLPSGRIALRAAMRAGSLAMASAMALYWTAGVRAGAAGTALACNILAYNFLLKRSVFGPVVMGLCRGMSVLAGSLAIAAPIPRACWVAAGAIALFVSGVSFYARGETRSPGRPARVGVLLGLIPLVQAGLILAYRRDAAGWTCATILLLLALASRVLRHRYAAS